MRIRCFIVFLYLPFFTKEIEKLKSELESAKKKCYDTETEMKIKIEELNETISTLQEKIVKEESDKLEAITSYGKEKKARSAAEKVVNENLAKIEKVQDEK
ncbi:hypothetical protein RJT34_16132 [Clitoria ternatea]|uniref:Uncharacterized protein n=1 Tax=Clitoria ternatea TaxID=43366 RepID=A0AAN9PDE5_CLITE